MILMKGQGVSGGVVTGPLFFWARRSNDPIAKTGGDVNKEKKRFSEARQAAVRQMNDQAELSREVKSNEAADLMEVHAMLAEDEDFTAAIHEWIEKENCSAEYAVQMAGEQFAGMFGAMEDSYMQARAADIRDVAQRIVDCLQGREAAGIHPETPVILAADDLAPSETVRLDPKIILALITRGGTANGHTAILARNMGIPAICGLRDQLKEQYAGETAYADGGEGTVILSPDAEALSAFEKKQRKQQENQNLLEELKGQEDITRDGKRIMLYCNIASVSDIPAVLHNDGQGIGLFRSEFLFLSSSDYPSEDQQFNIYRIAAEAMKGKRVVIRTLDVGADKQAEYLHIKKEENPALGLRGVRVSLNRQELFRTQLRALYRASAYGRIAIMFPMITSVWEVRECRRICREVMEELAKEGEAYRPETEIGAMIETPAAILIADELAREVDFFSVGTNDLTQYMLACDRQIAGLERFFDPRHPAVLRSIHMAAEAAHKAGIWIGVCGELAADTEILPAFLAMGIDELSVTPASVLPLRREIRKSSAQDCTIEY